MNAAPHPIAWAVFADNGNIRLWSTDRAEVLAFADKVGAPLIALHPGPPIQSAHTDDAVGNACRLLRDAAQELAEGISVNGVPDWKNEPETHGAYVEHITAAHRLEQWADSIGAGGVEPLRKCLHQIAEPAGERTAKDYAIEHAEYMAQDAERLLSAINTLNAQRDEDGDAFDESALEQAQQAVSEAFGVMRSGIYEFRKRRDRAMRAQAALLVNERTDPRALLQAVEDALDKADALIRTDDGHWLSLPQRIADLAAKARPAAPAAVAVRESFDADGFKEWVKRNLPDNTIIGSGEWWAHHLTLWALRFCTVAAAPQPPVAQGDALPREDFARLVVQEACETEPADEDDPECIRILRRDLKSAVLAAFLRDDAARAQAKEGGAA